MCYGCLDEAACHSSIEIIAYLLTLITLGGRDALVFLLCVMFGCWLQVAGDQHMDNLITKKTTRTLNIDHGLSSRRHVAILLYIGPS